MLKEIRKQPESIRTIFMWLSVIIVFTSIGYVWFSEFQNHLVALVNPNFVPEQDRFLANVSGPLGGLKNSFKSLSASLGNLVNLGNSSTEQEQETNEPVQTLLPQLLPDTN